MKKHYKLSNVKNNKLDYESRIILYHALHNKLKNNDDCKDNLPENSPNIYILLNEGGFSTNWKKQISLNNHKYNYALKIQNVKPFIIKDKFNTKYNLWREYDILGKCTNLVLNKVTCNLPLLYDLKICENESRVIFYNELANGSFIDWIYMEHTIGEWESFLFQLWMGMFILQKHLKLVHNDLRFGNVLYHETNNAIHKYIIGDKEYYVPNHGYTFVIWDFGGAKLDNDTDNITKQKLEYSTDLHFFHDAYNRLRVLMLLNKYTGIELESFFTTGKDFEYMKNKREECERRFRRMGRYDEKCKIALVYYLIENGRFDELYNAKKDNLSGDKIVKIPPPEIMKILKELSENYNYEYDDIIQFNTKMKKKIPSLEFLIEKYFSKFHSKQKYDMEFIA
jgi:hypothetical protein